MEQVNHIIDMVIQQNEHLRDSYSEYPDLRDSIEEAIYRGICAFVLKYTQQNTEDMSIGEAVCLYLDEGRRASEITALINYANSYAHAYFHTSSTIELIERGMYGGDIDGGHDAIRDIFISLFSEDDE